MVTSKRRPGLIAFAATLLLAQLVLTAGHIHLGRLQSAAQAGTSTPLAPNDPHEHGQPCPLCLAKAAAQTLLLPPPVQTPLPARLFAGHLVGAVTHHAARLAATAFDPRAPPAA